jgi:hypothetical protein
MVMAFKGLCRGTISLRRPSVMTMCFHGVKSRIQPFETPEWHGGG